MPTVSSAPVLSPIQTDKGLVTDIWKPWFQAITQGVNSGGVSYPGVGVPVSTGSAWGTSYSVSGSGSLLAVSGAMVGGSVDNSPIGATTPKTGKFTSLAGGTSGTGYTFDAAAPSNSFILNSKGILGLGINPSTLFGSTTKGIQVGSAGTSVFQDSGSGNPQFNYNIISSGGLPSYVVTGKAVSVSLSNNGIFVSCAPSGTAGSSATTTPVFNVGLNTCLGLQGSSFLSAGTGISFPSVQSASTDPNTLDDYAEGTWTPTATATGITFSTAGSSGTYTKVGRLVTLNFILLIGTVAGAQTGVLTVAGLPFSSGVRSVGISRESATTGNIWSLTIAAGSNVLSVLKYDNTIFVASGWQFDASISFTV